MYVSKSGCKNLVRCTMHKEMVCVVDFIMCAFIPFAASLVRTIILWKGSVRTLLTIYLLLAKRSSRLLAVNFDEKLVELK